ncbi:FxSxx-COOH system tetratricopeptide repeat protein [Streptacidiphilus sp. N1-3]|uniref:FxSxx-COOH system tetratricopeptide repeat protein n=1 Tax=Streptacidiphilus alkalitolerans TaxID=3342712 RepID=A0ABV6WUW1_9ACTN
MELFVSHAGADRAWAEWVAWELTDAGHTVELDAWHWAAGDNFIAKMNDALAGGARMVALLSEAYFEPSRFTTEEWTAVLAAKEQLVPLRIDATAPLPLFRALLAPALYGLPEAEARTVLLRAVAGAPGRPGSRPPFPTNAGRLRTSGPRLPGSLPPVWNIPLRNPGFMGRDGMLVRLREALTAAGGRPVTVHALNGRGGLGKTQLAIEYAHRFAGEYELAWWINAEDPALVPDQLAALAVKTGAAQPDTPPTEACQALTEELRTRARWLLVFDNAEEPAALAPHLPGGPGHVLITSRNPRWLTYAKPLDVDVFARDESTALLHTRVPTLNRPDADRLAQELDDLPLALAQAAAVLADGMTLAQYRDLFTSHTAQIMDEGQPEDYPVSLAAQIRLSSNRLATSHPGAWLLLQACALLAPEPFPLHSCTQPVADPPPELADLLGHPLAARKALRVLARLGLARAQDGTVQLHRLTQAVLRDQLTDEQRTRAQHAAETLLDAAAPTGTDDPATWPAWAALIPHLLAVDPAALTTESGQGAARDACWYLLDRANTATALPRLEHLYHVWAQQYGPDHEATLWTATYLARAYDDTGDHAGARDLDQDILRRRRHEFGDDHPDTLASAHNLAIRLASLGEVEAARDLGQDTLERRRRILGEDIPDTLSSASNLAGDLITLGETEAARDLAQDTLQRGRRVLGDDHPATLFSAHNLAIALAALGETEAARDLAEDTLERRRRVLGDDHPSTLSTARVLATLTSHTPGP